MRLESLATRGMTCFDDELSVDLTKLPTNGIIAVTGPNGAGKSTFLELIVALMKRQFPSRSGKELFDYATTRASYIAGQVSFDGRGTYRCRINLDNEKRVSEALLVQVMPDGTEVPLNDGKVRTYDQEADRLFPDYSLFMASAFISQDRSGSFAGTDKKGRKNIFIKGFGLERLEGLSQTAKQAAALVETARERLVILRDQLAVKTAVEIRLALDADEVCAETEMARVTGLRTDLQTELIRLEAELVTLRDQATRFHAAVATLAVTRPAITVATHDADRLRQGLVALRTQYDADGETLTHRLEVVLADIDALLCDEEPLNQELAAIDENRVAVLARLEVTAADTSLLTQERAAIALDLQKQEADIDVRLGNNLRVLEQADEIRQAVVIKTQAEQTVAKLRQQETELRQVGRDLQVQLDTVREEIAKLFVQIEPLAHWERTLQTLSDVPCGGADGEFGACRFLTDAKPAADHIIQIRQALVTKQARENERAALDAARHANEQALVTLGTQLALAEQQMAQMEPKAKLLPTVETAEARIADLKAQRREYQQQAGNRLVGAEVREHDRQVDLQARREGVDADTAIRQVEAQAREQARQTSLRARYTQVQADATAETAKLALRYEEQRAAYDTQLLTLTGRQIVLKKDLLAAEQDEQDFASAATRVTVLQAEQSTARARWDESTVALAKASADQSDVVRRRREFDAATTELTNVQARIGNVTDELVEWNLLAKALSRDGLPTLLIANAGPVVSAYANELMAAAYGPRFSMDLVTQEPTSDGKGLKEVFSLKVWDNERGGEARDIGDLSGGEQVIVAEALANAIALTVNAQNQQPIRTCWRDETTGALHPDTALQYVAMLRKVQELGGFERIYYITHNPDAAALADAQLCFHDGTMDVRLPPYAAQESA